MELLRETEKGFVYSLQGFIYSQRIFWFLNGLVNDFVKKERSVQVQGMMNIRKKTV